jgi:hypothetical protein
MELTREFHNVWRVDRSKEIRTTVYVFAESDGLWQGYLACGEIQTVSTSTARSRNWPAQSKEEEQENQILATLTPRQTVDDFNNQLQAIEFLFL